jgi:hypothetical protein
MEFSASPFFGAGCHWACCKTPEKWTPKVKSHFFARIDCRGMPPRSCRRENMSCLSAIADVVAAVFRVLVNCYATARCRYSLTPPALLSGASRSICQVNAACQTIPYVRLGRYLASLFVPVWRTTYNRTAGLRGMNANIDIQRQFCA